MPDNEPSCELCVHAKHSACSTVNYSCRRLPFPVEKVKEWMQKLAVLCKHYAVEPEPSAGEKAWKEHDLNMAHHIPTQRTHFIEGFTAGKAYGEDMSSKHCAAHRSIARAEAIEEMKKELLAILGMLRRCGWDKIKRYIQRKLDALAKEVESRPEVSKSETIAIAIQVKQEETYTVEIWDRKQTRRSVMLGGIPDKTHARIAINELRQQGYTSCTNEEIIWKKEPPDA